ncbi:FtsK/SpoIIIE domain-containing protein [uncultured Nocardioides sp.]|nr:FtsK/SpoIIIE domain-containing protein [uncultured Nocardioides sp.]
MYRYDDGLTLRDRIEDNEWVARARFGWELATLAPRMAFTSLAALLLLFAGVGMVLVGLTYLGFAVWVARQTGDAPARLLRHPWRLGTWLAAPVGLTAAVAIGLTNAVLAVMIIGCLAAARWMAPKVVERPVEPTLPITYAETVDEEVEAQWNAYSLDWVARRWPEIARDVGLAYKKDIPTRLTRAQAYLQVTDAGYRTEQKVRELTEGKAAAYEWITPEIEGVHVTPLGPILSMRPWGGQSAADFERVADRIAVAYEVRGVRVAVTEPGLIDVQLLGRDPLARGMAPVDVAQFAEPVEVVEPWHVGFDEDGEPVELDLAGSAHMLIAGATRSGKSVCTYGLITHVLRMGASARLLVADPNDTTLAPFEEKVAWATSSVDPAPVTEMLQWVRREMGRRKPILRAMRQDKVEPWQFSDELPLVVVVIDEAANYLRHPNGKEMREELLAVVSQGAKYGVRLILITQRPDSTILDTSTRSQLSARICMKVEDRQTAAMVFPDLDDPDALLTMPPGVGFVREVGGRARRFRGLYLADHWGAADVIPAPQPRIDVRADGLTVPAPSRSAHAVAALADEVPAESYAPEPETPSEFTVADLHEAGEVGRRTANRLGSLTLAEVSSMSRAELLALPGIGAGSVTELEAALHARGLALREDEEADRDDA